MNVRCVILALFSTIFCDFSFAQEKPLNVEDCVQFALENNPLLKAGQFSVRAADEEVSSVKGKFFPEASARTTFRRWESHAFLPPGVGFPGFSSVVGPTNDWLFSLRGNYLVFDSGSRSSELKAAQAQRSATAEDLENARLDVVLQVRAAFYQLLVALEQIDLAKERLSRSEDHVKLAQDKKDAGAVPLSDVTQARAELANSKLNLVSAESDIRIARATLNNAMGRSVDMEVEISETEAEVIPPQQFAPSSDDWGNLVSGRPDIKAAKQRVEARKNQIGIAKSELLPRVRAEAGYGVRDEDFFPSDKDWYVGMTLDVPIFDGNTRKHRVAKTRVEVSREEAQLQQLILSAQKEISTAHSRMIEAFESIEASKAFQQEASESSRLTRERYGAGAGTINDLLDAEFSLNQAEVSTVRSEYLYLIAHAEWLRAIGK
ncbi:MAG TPA: TolC family protein [Acidobacteriota bacterium]|nr:TolC family protein [Acidobacteriota bacterium]